MSLQEKLEAQKAKSAGHITPEMRAVMVKATADLHASGILSRVLKEGDSAPDFELENVHGERVTSAALLERGPLVTTFYRGVW